MRLSTLVRTGTAILGPARPVILYHKPTDRCDCRCKFCDFWVRQPQQDDSLPSEKILPLIERVHAAGITMYSVWGGEPLLIDRLPEWLDRATELGMMVTVCTSGYRLSERVSELASNLDQLYLSLEAVGERQDIIRGTPGLFQRLTQGLQEFKKRAKGEVVLWSNLSRENQDQVEEIARFAKEMGIGLEFFPTAGYLGYNEKILLDAKERDEVFSRIFELKRRGYPIYNPDYSLELMRSGRPFKCNFVRMGIHVFPQGEIYHCQPRLIPGLLPFSHIDELDFQAFPASPVYREAMEKYSTCNACLFPCVANMADSLPLQAFRRLVNRFYYRSRF